MKALFQNKKTRKMVAILLIIAIAFNPGQARKNHHETDDQRRYDRHKKEEVFHTISKKAIKDVYGAGKTGDSTEKEFIL